MKAWRSGASSPKFVIATLLLKRTSKLLLFAPWADLFRAALKIEHSQTPPNSLTMGSSSSFRGKGRL